MASPQTRMQVVSASPSAVYTGVSHAMATISRLEGAKTLWRGVSSVIVGAGISTTSLTPGYDEKRLTRVFRGVGPAHAVYFATYEAVKHAMGGNKDNEHHPLAAGMFSWQTRIASKMTETDGSGCSDERRMRDDSKRRTHEPLRR